MFFAEKVFLLFFCVDKQFQHDIFSLASRTVEAFQQLAQMVERQSYKLYVIGSNPVLLHKICIKKYLDRFFEKLPRTLETLQKFLGSSPSAATFYGGVAQLDEASVYGTDFHFRHAFKTISAFLIDRVWSRNYQIITACRTIRKNDLRSALDFSPTQ